jgi:hypothetical protein
VHTEIPELAPQIHGELVGAVDVIGARCDLGAGELLQGVAQHGDVFAEVELQSGQVDHGTVLSGSRLDWVLDFRSDSA